MSQPSGARHLGHRLGRVTYPATLCQGKRPHGHRGSAVTVRGLSFAALPDKFPSHRFADRVGSIEESGKQLVGY